MSRFSLWFAFLLSAAAAAFPAAAAVAENPGYPAAWSAEDEATLLQVLNKAADEGLDPNDYLVTAQGRDRDRALTEKALAYLSDVRHGRAALEALDDDVALPAAGEDNAAGLAQALQKHQLLALLGEARPPSPQYAALKQALAFYRGIRDRGGWPVLSTNAAMVRPDQLRQRLAYEDPTAVTGDLTDALKRFQGRHGLQADGRLNGRTLAELNVTADRRVLQIVANMERWRWLPRRLEADRVMVNVPDASLKLVLNGKDVLYSRVVVGKPRTPTPILRAEGAGITINPPWNVPDSIARKEILPKLKANPRYLQSEDMILLNGPPGDPYGLHVRWRDIPAGTFPYRLQQHPGRKNALGTIKIELPNRFDVYLHDTPAKRAFAPLARDISHGCVRVERILPLASYGLTANLEAMSRISEAVAAGGTQYLPFSRKLPVYFVYWTAFTDEAGILQFRPDIYGRDKRLIAQLQGFLKITANFANCSRG